MMDGSLDVFRFFSFSLLFCGRSGVQKHLDCYLADALLHAEPRRS